VLPLRTSLTLLPGTLSPHLAFESCTSQTLTTHLAFLPSSTRPLPMDIHIQSYDVPHFPSLMLGMAKPAYLAINDWAGQKPVIAFVPSRKQCKLTATDILTYCSANQEEKRFLNIDEEDLAPHLERIQDSSLKETLAYGIGFYHEALTKQDKRIVERLFESGAIQVLVASKVGSLPFSSVLRNQSLTHTCLPFSTRTRLGASLSRLTWSSLWASSTLTERTTDTPTTPSPTFSR
jgi:hypothetical protein